MRLQGLSSPEELRGALEAVLIPAIGPVPSRETAALLVDQACFDTSEALRDLTPATLAQLLVPVGRHARICRALFGGEYQIPQTPSVSVFSAPAGPQASALPPIFNVPAAVVNVPAPVVNVTAPAPVVNVAPPGQPRALKVPWPSPNAHSLPPPEAFLDFGLGLRAFLRAQPQVRDSLGDPVAPSPVDWSDVVFGSFTRPWDDAPASHVHSGPHDRLLAAALLSAPGAVPAWAAPLVRQPFREDRALQALLALSRQVAVASDASDKAIKRAVRAPRRESNPQAVSLRLAKWDSDLSACLSRGFVIDEHDRRSGLLQLVHGLAPFRPVLAALETADITDPGEIRRRLGVTADRLRSSDGASGASAFPASSSSARAGSSSSSLMAIKQLAGALGSAAGSGGKPLCWTFRDKGSCKKGDKCKFSHDLVETKARKAFLSACGQFFDGGGARGESAGSRSDEDY